MTVFKNMVTSIKTWKALSTKLPDKSTTDQAKVVKRVDNAYIHWINFCPGDNTYSLDSNLSGPSCRNTG